MALPGSMKWGSACSTKAAHNFVKICLFCEHSAPIFLLIIPCLNTTLRTKINTSKVQDIAVSQSEKNNQKAIFHSKKDHQAARKFTANIAWTRSGDNAISLYVLPTKYEISVRYNSSESPWVEYCDEMNCLDRPAAMTVKRVFDLNTCAVSGL